MEWWWISECTRGEFISLAFLTYLPIASHDPSLRGHKDEGDLNNVSRKTVYFPKSLGSSSNISQSLHDVFELNIHWDMVRWNKFTFSKKILWDIMEQHS